MNTHETPSPSARNNKNRNKWLRSKAPSCISAAFFCLEKNEPSIKNKSRRERGRASDKPRKRDVVRRCARCAKRSRRVASARNAGPLPTREGIICTVQRCSGARARADKPRAERREVAAERYMAPHRSLHHHHRYCMPLSLSRLPALRRTIHRTRRERDLEDVSEPGDKTKKRGWVASNALIALLFIIFSRLSAYTVEKSSPKILFAV